MPATSSSLVTSTSNRLHRIRKNDAATSETMWRRYFVLKRLPKRPGADRADIDVHELRDRVEADSAGVQRESGVAQRNGADAGDADVDGLGQHVLAVLGDAGVGAAGAQEVVAPWRAVAADNVDYAVGAAEPSHDGVEDVELFGIVTADVVGAVVAQEVVQLVERFGDIGVADAVDDVDVFSGVEMVHAQMIFLRQR